jgi:bifunctional ADP-heptose synthase (sugar kinase/adenylyltransferase)
VPVRLVTALCADEEGEWLARALGERVELVAGPAAGGTCMKIRLLDRGRPLARLDYGRGAAAGATSAMREALADAGAVLVADYGRGVSTDPRLLCALDGLAEHVPVVWDPHPRGGRPVRGCAMVTPNLDEARRALRPTEVPAGSVDGALRAAGLLTRQWSAAGTAVTVGAHGAALALSGVGGPDTRLLPAPPAPPTADTCGAGDRFASAVAAALREGAGPVAAVTTAVGRASAFVAEGGAGAVRVTQDSRGRTA